MSDIWQDLTDLLERNSLLEALVIILVFAVGAKIADWVVTRLLKRVVVRSQTDFDDRLVALLHRPVFFTVLFIGLITATRQLDLSRDTEEVTVLLVQTILVIVWVAFAFRFVRLVLRTMRGSSDRFTMVQGSTEPLFTNAATVILFVAGAYSIFVIWDINVGGLLASAGIVGLALGFAAQDTLSNLFAGVAILSDKPYELGDFIILDSGERGEVIKIGLRSTRLLTRDDVEISIPNSVMGATKIINEAGGPPGQYRIRVTVGVAYGSDIDVVERVLMDIATSHPKILTAPEARVRFREFGDSSLGFELLGWIERPADRGLVTHELLSTIYKRFNAEGVVFPFPQQDVYVKEFPGRSEGPAT